MQPPLQALARTCRAQGKHDEAASAQERVVRIFEITYGSESHEVAGGLEAYAANLRGAGRGAEADQAEARSKAIRARLEQPSGRP
jgi:hypothetical protein